MIWILSVCHLQGKCVCNGKEITMVLKLHSMYEYVLGVSSVSVCLLYVCTYWMCDFQLPGNGHSFPLMYPVKNLNGSFIASRIQCLSIS